MFVHEILALLGPATLVPIPRGKNRPISDGWQNFGAAQMENRTYRSQLNNGSNIAVLLGTVSNKLAIVTLFDTQWIEPYLEANPKLRQTLQTKLRHEGTFWIRVVGDFPPIKAIFHPTLKEAGGEPLKIGEFRSVGCQIISGEVNGLPCCTVINQPPVEMSFAEIVWPEFEPAQPILDVAKPAADETTPPPPELPTAPNSPLCDGVKSSAVENPKLPVGARRGSGRDHAAEHLNQPAVSWLRDFGFLVLKSGTAGRELLAAEIYRLSTAAQLAIPGMRKPDDKQGAKMVGRVLAMCFRTGNRVEIDHMTIDRIERSEYDPASRKDVIRKYYRFT
jgi:hypothetical protein